MATGVVQSFVDKQKWIDGISDALQPIINNTFSSGGDAGKVAKDLLNGVWLGHPLHPVLSDVPIGAWTMTELFDVLSAMSGDDDTLDRAADITLGAGLIVVPALVLSGLTDWSDVGGSHRRMGMAHALLNTAATVFYGSSMALRAGGNKRSRGLARTLSATGYIVNALAAFVAGELVYNLGQAVNRDAWVSGPEKFTDVTAEADLQEGKMQKFDIENQPVVLIKDRDGVHAFNGTCTHYGCGLWEGKLEGHTVTCQCHGSQFDVRDGKIIHGPATAPVPAYRVRRRQGRIQVRLEQ